MSTTTGKLVFGCGLVLCMIALGSILLSQDGSLQNRAGDNPLEFEVAEKPQRLVVVTRVHMKSASSMPDTGKVLSFIQNTKLYSDGIIICVGASDVTQINLYIDSVVHLLDERHEDHSTVIFLPVFPWGYFTTSLNAAILVAQDQMFDLIAFQSLEVSVSKYEVSRVLRRLSAKNTIVVGPVLEGHEFLGPTGTQKQRGGGRKVALTGRTVPWNTFAVWRLRELGLLGFPLIGDGTAEDRAMGGVEELTAITMLQRLNPQYTAVLLRIPPPSTTAAHSNNNSQHESGSGVKDAKMTVSAWDTKFEDPQRQQYHDKKMQSKNSRPAAQLQALSIDAGHVLHEIDL